MQRLEDLEEFWNRLRRTGRGVLLLDYDGTLAPFREERLEAFPYPGVTQALKEIVDAGASRISIISGRECGEVLGLLGLDRPVECWGSHGLERRLPDGSTEMASQVKEMAPLLALAEERVLNLDLGKRLERKPGCLAVHVRGVEEKEASTILDRVRGKWAELAGKEGLLIKRFNGGLEIRVPGPDKGYAVRTVLKETGSDKIAVAYLGDDLTDEDAFRALGENGLSVLVRPEPRETLAQAYIRPPGELLEFLRKWCEAGADKPI